MPIALLYVLFIKIYTIGVQIFCYIYYNEAIGVIFLKMIEI